MNKKRWLAVAIAVVLFAISIAAPKYKFESETISQLDTFKNIFGDGSISEVVQEAGDHNSRILLMELSGTIQSGGSNVAGGYDHDFFLEQLDNVVADKSINGVLLLVDTPGGGVYESAEIRDRLLKIKEARGIPVYIQMLGMAASGGYYISADATKIYATQETITGSIGVISTTFDISGLLDKYGVAVNNYTSGNMKAMGSPYKAPTEEEAAIWQNLIDDAFGRFVSLIASGRNMSEEKVRALADGRIYTANQALELGLIDKIAFKEECLIDLKTENGLENSEVFYYEKNSGNQIFNYFNFMKSTIEGNSELYQLRHLMENYKSMPTPMYLYGGR